MPLEPFPIATLELAGGGRIGVCPLPGSRGPFDADFRTVLAWAPDIVISMTGLDEMERAGGAELPERLGKEGIAWRHLPVLDYGGPRGANLAAWPALSRELHSVLDTGGAVLAHCHGGRGRSGMMALRLLIERGEDEANALARIRAARPGAVEAESQFAWAAEGRATRWLGP